jgi:methanogenic corrinoid protein MtbC1
MIAASIGNELHEIGIRMVADFFEMEGWNTYYLGANVPQNSFLQEIKNKKPNIVAISVTISFNLQNISALIQKIRKIDPNVKIMVGGYPFLVDTKLWEKVGADASAQNAQEALKLAEKLVV